MNFFIYEIITDGGIALGAYTDIIERNEHWAADLKVIMDFKSPILGNIFGRTIASSLEEALGNIRVGDYEEDRE